MKRIILSLLIVINILTFTAFSQAKPDLMGEAAILIDYSTGNILFEKNSHKEMYPASTTKVLTALIILEDLELDELVVIDESAARTGGSSMRLKAEEVFTVEELLFGLMVASGNDSAVALAIHHSGSVEAFAKVMTERAAQVGALHSNFTNPNGLPHEDHYTTAYDLAMISKKAMSIEKFRELVGTPKYQVMPTNFTSSSRYLASKNKFLQEPAYYNNLADGIKTGWTPAAKNCFVGTAKKNDFRVISVVLKSTKSFVFDDTKKLFNYGYNNYRLQAFCAEGDLIDTMNMKGFYGTELNAKIDHTYNALVPKSIPSDAFQTSVTFNDALSLPILKDDTVGYVEYMHDGLVYGRTDIVAAEDVEDIITIEDKDYYMLDLVSLYLL